jgi:hypothetical protein
MSSIKFMIVGRLLLVRDLTKHYLLFQKSHLSQLTGMEVYLKKDFLQYTGR